MFKEAKEKEQTTNKNHEQKKSLGYILKKKVQMKMGRLNSSTRILYQVRIYQYSSIIVQACRYADTST